MPKAGSRYNYAHQKERERWRPTVDAGLAYCAQPECIHPTRWIEPGTPWDLGHSDDGTAWIGPTHRDCNQLAGASKGGRKTAKKASITPHSMNW